MPFDFSAYPPDSIIPGSAVPPPAYKGDEVVGNIAGTRQRDSLVILTGNSPHPSFGGKMSSSFTSDHFIVKYNTTDHGRSTFNLRQLICILRAVSEGGPHDADVPNPWWFTRAVGLMIILLDRKILPNSPLETRPTVEDFLEKAQGGTAQKAFITLTNQAITRDIFKLLRCYVEFVSHFNCLFLLAAALRLCLECQTDSVFLDGLRPQMRRRI